MSQIVSQNRKNKLMQGKDRKVKEYYLEGRTSTAKKVKKNKGNDSQTPNSHSTSHNHYKYEKEIDYLEQETNKKYPLQVKQMKMIMRCMQEYCSQNNNSCQEVSTQYQIAAQIFRHLQANYKIVGKETEVIKNEKLLQQLTPHTDQTCPYCRELGYSCDDYQRETLENCLKEDIDHLQNELLQVFRKRELLQESIKAQQLNQNRQLSLQNLKKVEKLQKEILCQLSKPSEQRELSKLFSLQTKVSRQQENG